MCCLSRGRCRLRAMPDLSELTAHIARLAGSDFSRSSEQDTRERAVNPVIGALGWNVYDPNEVDREYSVRGGRVDYCLRTQERNFVLVEVKRAGTDLTEHQEQLLRYAFDEGVPLAALTDGLVWWLYLPTAGTSWEQRLFFRVSFREQQPAEAAAALFRFLNRNGVVSGEAQDEAKREFESQERDRRVQAALQDAWQRVLRDPESLVREELAEAVEDISGHRPSRETVADFLNEMSGNTKTDNRSLTAPLTDSFQEPGLKDGSRTRSNTQRVETKKPTQSGKTKSRSIPPVAFWLGGKRHELHVLNWRQMLIQLCEHLARETGHVFVERASNIRGRKRPHFTSSPAELREPVHIPGTRLYVEGNVSAKGAEQIARRALREVRGSDDSFYIEMGEPPSEA